MKVEGVSGGVALTIGGAAADDAAASGNPVPIGGVYQDTVTEVGANDIARVRVTLRRAQVQAPDQRQLILTASEPVPSNSDVVSTSGAAITAADLEIRDNSAHYFFIPMQNWRDLTISLQRVVSFSGGSWTKLTISIFGAVSNQIVTGQLGQFEWVNPAWTTISSAGAVGQGGIAGSSSTSTTRTYYSVLAMAGAWGFICLQIQADNAPTAGEISLRVARRS
jgi:hypothetical protein